MPIYTYQCPQCLTVKDEYMKMSLEKDANPVKCPTCIGFFMRRVPSVPHTDMKPFHTPIEMFSIATEDINEIRKMQKAGVNISDDPNSDLYGVPVAACRKEKLAALAVAGYTETN